MPKRLAIVGAPSSAGAYAPGQEKAPAALRATGPAVAFVRVSRHTRLRSYRVSVFRWLCGHSERTTGTTVANAKRRGSLRQAIWPFCCWGVVIYGALGQTVPRRS